MFKSIGGFMQVDLERQKKTKHNMGLAEGGFIGTFATVDRYLHPLIEQGGLMSILLLPIFEIVRAGLYWARGNDEALKDGMQKIWINRAYYTGKAMVTTIGVVYALCGFLPLGFGLIIAGSYVGTLRHLLKALNYVLEGNVEKSERNIQKVLIGGLITGGFTLLTFFPSLTLLGWSMVLAATSTVVLSGLPRLLASMVKEKPLVLPEFSYNIQHVINPLTLASSVHVVNNYILDNLVGIDHDRQNGMDTHRQQTSPRSSIQK
jgi:uncharacterized membrane protein